MATDKQIAAGARNYALFQVKGMRGNIHHLRDHVPDQRLYTLIALLEDMERHLRQPPRLAKASTTPNPVPTPPLKGN